MLTLAAGAVLIGVLWWQAARLRAEDATAAGRAALALLGGGGLAALALAALIAGAPAAALVALAGAAAVTGPALAPLDGILRRWSGRAALRGAPVPRPSSRRFSSPPAG